MEVEPSPVQTRRAPFTRWFWTVRLLAVLALGLCGYLLIVAARNEGPGGCGAQSGCEEVLASRWSRWLTMPVSAPAIGLYALLLLATSKLSLNNTALARRCAWVAILALLAAIAASALWLIALQLFVLHKVCPWCMAAHACALLLAFAIFRRAASAQSGGQEFVDDVPRLGRATLAAIPCAGILGLGLLVAGQLHASRPLAIMSFGNATVYIDRARFPALGSPDAPHFAVAFFDYTCPDCRNAHRLFEQAMEKWPGQWSIALLPFPLDSKCNPNIRQTAFQHKDACALAHLALAVWHAAPAKFPAMDHWLCQANTPPTAAEAHEYAMNLVGANKSF